jgi:putative ABC transport system permease protein
MPADFQFPVGSEPVEVWRPATATLFAASRGGRFLTVVGRLRDGVTIEQAKADLGAVAAALEQQYPDSDAGYGVQAEPLGDALFGDVRTPMLMLLAAVGFVLLIACTNVANLLLARALSRQKEIAIRAALGASRWRLVRQMLTESLVLSLAGGALGLLLAVWGSSAIAALVANQLPRASTIAVDARVVAFTFAVSILTGVLFGLAPALRLARTDPNEALVDTARGATEGARHNRLRSLLVVSEVALSVVLLVGAGLMIRSFVELIRVDAGFKTAHVLTMEITLPGSVMEDDPFRASRFFDDVLARVRALPGVTAAGASTTLPMGGSKMSIGFSVAGKTTDEPGQQASSPFDVVSPDYFRAMGIPVLAGREFTERDTEKSLPVVVISESLAHRYWPSEDPVGKRMRPDYSASKDDDEEEAPEREIVGVVGDVKHDGLKDDAKTAIYTPLAQTPLPFASLVVVSDADPSSLTETVRREVLAVDHNQPIANVRLLDRVVSDSVARPRLYMTLLAIFAAVALVLTVIGIYGVIAYSVRRRTHEIGVRIALGATSGNVLGLVVRQGMALVLIGVALGVVAALGVTRFMASLLFGVAPTDPLTFGGVALLLAAFALLSIDLPARRAARLDPTVALREE